MPPFSEEDEAANEGLSVAGDVEDGGHTRDQHHDRKHQTTLILAGSYCL